MTCYATITVNDVHLPCEDHVDGWHHAYWHYPQQPKTHVAKWQDAPKPERDWQPGDVVMDATGALYERIPHLPGSVGWRGKDRHYADANLKRPLTRLVPAAEPVDLYALRDLISDARDGGDSSTEIARDIVKLLKLESA